MMATMATVETRKIIFFDIDGTLIDNKTGLMSDSTREAIRIARENGHICMINTGRTQRLVGKEITDQAEFDGYLMGCGTMVVYHNEVLFHKTLTMEQSGHILEALKKHRIDALLEGREQNFCDVAENMYTEVFRNFLGGCAGTFYGTMDNALGRYDKIYAYTDEPVRMEAFRQEFCEELDFIDRENGFFEIVPMGYSKATAIRYMADFLQLPMENTVAIGDSNNDLPMLECSHIGIAMGNSTANVLEVADYVTTDVSEDGIWNALKWLGVLD